MKAKNRLLSKNGRLAKNTIMLFVLTFSNYLFNFITIPYQTRVLGPAVYGNLGFATSIMSYFQLLLDFGFMLSATEDISKNREDHSYVSRVLTCVTWCKAGLIALSFAVLAVLCLTVSRFQSDVPLFFLYLGAYSIYAFLPDFLYRGIEEMQVITVRSVLIKLFCTCMIFVFLRSPSQYYVVPLMTGIGNLGAVLGVSIHVHSLGYRFVRVSRKEVWETFRRSSFFFYSRIASAVYTATNTFLLGMIYGASSPLVGYYSTAEKGVAVAKQAITPVTDSLYPYMVKNRNFKLMKKLLLIGMPLLFVGCGVVMIFAEPLCAFVFGAEYYEAGTYLRLLAPVVFFSYPGMMFGFPLLTPMGLAKYANISTIIAAALQIAMLLGLFLTVGITPVNICIATCITELFTCVFRVVVVFRNRRLLKEQV